MAKILAVDDSASMRKMVSVTLNSAGHEVMEACDGKQALEFAKMQTVDLVLTDVNMPLMDGLTLTRQLRALAAYHFTPILILTTEIDIEKKQEARAAGATGWLVKPFNPEQLIATVEKVMG